MLLKKTDEAGHSLVTPGKQSPDGYNEWSYTNAILKNIIVELSHYQNLAQHRIDDPTGKTDKPLSRRSDEANSWGTNIHFSHHMNAYGVGWTSPGGTEVFIHPDAPKAVRELAAKIQANLVRELGFANRGVKEANFHMLREINGKNGILIEYAFMSNKNEAMKMRTADYQKKAAKAVVDAFVNHYGLKRKDVANVDRELTTREKEIQAEAIRLGFTDGKNPLREVNQLYLWACLIPLARRIKDLEK